MCQNSDYISKKWWYLSNQEQLKIEKPKWKRVRVLSRYFQSMGKWINRCADDTQDFQRPQSVAEEQGST